MYESDSGTPTLKHSSIAELRHLQSQRDLVDTWRIRNPAVKRFTYRQHKPLIQRRHDYFLISDYLQDYTKHTDILPAVQTDHSAIILKFSDSKGYQRGRSYWKFHNSLLTDNAYLGLMREKIDEFSAVNYFPDDPCLGWEFMKYRIKELNRKYSTTENAVRINLESKLKTLGNSLSSGCSDEILKEYEDCKTRVEILYDNVTNGLIVRSRVTWYEKGEKSNKFFHNLEKRNNAKTYVKTQHGHTRSGALNEESERVMQFPVHKQIIKDRKGTFTIKT